MRVDAGGCGHGADVYSVLPTPMGIDLHTRALTRTCPQMFSKSHSANPIQQIRKTALVSACFENLCRDAVLVCPASENTKCNQGSQLLKVLSQVWFRILNYTPHNTINEPG